MALVVATLASAEIAEGNWEASRKVAEYGGVAEQRRPPPCSAVLGIALPILPTPVIGWRRKPVRQSGVRGYIRMGQAMNVESLLPAARDRLVTIADHAPLIDAARLLRSGTDILVVCSAAGLLRGVITKTDVVAQISQCQGSGCLALSSVAMTKDVMLCRSGDVLDELWRRMNERSLKNIPFVDQDLRPIGVLNARDMLQALLKESTTEEAMMRDYVMGFGYR